uniref:Uncharacterized protein n=1 Tax=Cajanus cajan TaxID=3821 RepID=A0A151SJE1_CAJCA|nr:hypothetical protein KK1_001098 [Cajanus cajan]
MRCWEKGWRYIICELDCLEITKVLSNREDGHSHQHKHNNLIMIFGTFPRRIRLLVFLMSAEMQT